MHDFFMQDKANKSMKKNVNNFRDHTRISSSNKIIEDMELIFIHLLILSRKKSLQTSNSSIHRLKTMYK